MGKAPDSKANYTEGFTLGPLASRIQSPASPTCSALTVYTATREKVRRLPVKNTPFFYVLAVALAVASLPASAQYKWRDKTGVTQYSDMPPPAGTAEKDVLQQPASVSKKNAAPAPVATPASGVTVSAAPIRSGEPELEAKLRKTEQDKAAKTKAEDDKQVALRAENCTRAKAFQRTLDDGVRITRTDAKGEREFLDDKARAEEARRTKTVINSDCK